MGRNGDRRLVVVWAVLVAATLLSFVLGTDHDPLQSRTLSAIAIIVIAFWKIYLVGIHYMTLDRAPRLLRLAFELYVVVTCLALMVLYVVV